MEGIGGKENAGVHPHPVLQDIDLAKSTVNLGGLSGCYPLSSRSLFPKHSMYYELFINAHIDAVSFK